MTPQNLAANGRDTQMWAGDTQGPENLSCLPGAVSWRLGSVSLSHCSGSMGISVTCMSQQTWAPEAAAGAAGAVQGLAALQRLAGADRDLGKVGVDADIPLPLSRTIVLFRIGSSAAIATRPPLVVPNAPPASTAVGVSRAHCHEPRGYTER